MAFLLRTLGFQGISWLNATQNSAKCLTSSVSRISTVIIPKVNPSNSSTLSYTSDLRPSSASNLFCRRIFENNVQLLQTRGFKNKWVLKRRCKDCYFVWRDKRLYVICKTHPRHKQRQIQPPEWTKWILTHATQGKRKW